MPNPIIKQFVVEGTADFPIAMLNVDECWPARAGDAVAIAGDHSAQRTTLLRKIILATVSKYAPSRQRWIAHGWRVLD
ncbi:hypothetical protein [Sphingomonas sp. CROZ-RG-20F-R02-07]|uniref:hypothetical protein n=1 Tax=Sphingomonas sp. CROZ-RG-20F-R02-07 TaxID=2914832 RepID=UPI001F59A283|nr:hypothetical protein [Sphingomonas sp. CROZ-RG-20F-R02-07]